MFKTVRTLFGLGLVAITGAMAGCGCNPAPTKPAEQAPALPADTPPPAPTPPKRWSKFQGEGFSVNVPDAIRFKRKVEVIGGQPSLIPSNMWANSDEPPPPGQYLYLVTVDPLYPEGANAETDKMRAELKADPDKWWSERKKQQAAAGQSIENDKRIPIPGGFGWVCVTKFGNRRSMGGLALTDKRVYTWVVKGEKQPDENDPDVKAFFESFRIE